MAEILVSFSQQRIGRAFSVAGCCMASLGPGEGRLGCCTATELLHR